MKPARKEADEGKFWGCFHDYRFRVGTWPVAHVDFMLS